MLERWRMTAVVLAVALCACPSVETTDAGGLIDAGNGDAGTPVDAGGDGGNDDAGTDDAGTDDAGTADAGAADGGGAVVDFCPSYPNVTNVGMVSFGGANSQAYSSQLGGFDAEGVFLARFVAAQTMTANIGTANVAEYQGPPTVRWLTLSRSPCDFRDVDPTGANGPLGVGYGTTAAVQFTVAGTVSGVPKLVPGTTYYVNVRNYDFNRMGTSCLPGPTCDAVIAVNPPR